MKTDMHLDEEFQIWLNDDLLTDYFYVVDVRGRELANYDIEAITVPNREGSYYQDKRLQATPIEIEGIMMYESDEDLRQAYNELNQLLSPKTPGMLSFSDELGFSYYVTYSGGDSSKPVRANQKITMTFFRVDAYKYGIEEIRQFDNDAKVLVNNNGSADARPVYTITPTERLTHIDIANEQGDYIRIGQPVTVEENPIERRTRKLWDQASTFAGWTDAASVENGTITGLLKTNGYRFYTDDFGTGSGWHGPAKKTSIPLAQGELPIQDFTLDVHLRNIASTLDEIGRVEVSLLDENNNQVAKVMMAKYKKNSQQNQARVQAGDGAEYERIIDSFGDTDSTWARYDGNMRITRRGNRWEAYVYKRGENGRHVARDYTVWVDNNNTFMAPVTQVQAYVAQYGTHPVTTMSIDDIKVYRWNDNLQEQKPYIADEEDEIVFDFLNNDVLINNESIFGGHSELVTGVDLGSSFFPLRTGENNIYLYPDDKLTGNLTYRKRYV